MKLMNREPTEEMIEAGIKLYSSNGYTGGGIVFQAMYDAAPEIKVDMVPVAWVDKQDLERLSDFDAIYKRGGFDNAVPLYSADQVAALQAEIERLRNERGIHSYWGKRWAEESKKVIGLQKENEELAARISLAFTDDNKMEALLEQEQEIIKLTAERDDLLNHLKYWLPKEPPFFGVPHSQDVEIAKDIEQYGKTVSMITKYEGEKHG